LSLSHVWHLTWLMCVYAPEILCVKSLVNKSRWISAWQVCYFRHYFHKATQVKILLNLKISISIFTSIVLLLHYNFVCLWNMECFTCRHNFSAMALQLNKFWVWARSRLELLCESWARGWHAMWKKARWLCSL